MDRLAGSEELAASVTAIRETSSLEKPRVKYESGP
jgi:hypothetical protein